MVWAPFKCLFWNANHTIVKLMVSITSDDSSRYKPCQKINGTNVENLHRNKSRFSLIVAIVSGINLDREVKNLSPNFKRIT